MKILHVISSLDRRSGGPSVVIRNMVAGQIASGHQVALLTTTAQVAEPWQPAEDFRRGLLEDAAFRGAEVFVGRAFGRRRPWSTFAFSPGAAGWLRCRLAHADARPDVIHIHGTFEYLAVSAAAAARRSGIPYFFESYGSLHDDCLRLGHRRLKALFLRVFGRKLLQGAACVHPASEFEARAIRRFVPGDRIRVIPHGVNLPQEGWRAAGPSLLARFPALAGKRVILLLGRVHPIKRYDWAVEAVARLRPRFPDLAILLAGNDEGHLAGVLRVVRRSGMEDAFVHAGFLDGSAKEAAFAVASVLVLCSIHENFGLAAVEAMAHAVPVLLTPGVGAGDYVLRARAGVVVQDGLDGLTAGLQQLLQCDPQVAGARGAEFVAAELSWLAVVRRVDAMYRSVLSPE